MIREIIPVIQLKKSIKILKEKNDRCDINIPEGIDDVEIQHLEGDYKDAIETKNRLEDKAKTIIAALTIAVTLILNLSSILDTISYRYNSSIIDISIFILAILAIIYMLLAGVMSIHVLIKENIAYPLLAKIRTKQNKEEIYRITQLNVNQNLIRNNIIFSAYRSIRNSVICLVVLFVIAIFPSRIGYESQEAYRSVDDSEKVCLEIDAVNWMLENKQRKISFENIIKQYDKNNMGNIVKNIYDKDNGIIVTIRVEGDMYIVKNIISDIEELE